VVGVEGRLGGGAKRFCQTEHGRRLRYQKYAAGRAFAAIGVFSPRAKRQLKKGDAVRIIPLTGMEGFGNLPLGREDLG